MWQDNLRELKKKSGMTFKEIADASGIPESTVKRYFEGERNEPYASTLQRIVTPLGGTLDYVLADTNLVLSSEKLVEVKETLEEVKENANVMEAERDITKIENERLKVENERLKSENANLTTELQLLKQELQHKDELLELHKFYRKLIPNN